MSRTGKFLRILGWAAALAILAMAVFVATFDLNRYRDQLTRHLETALNRPVHLGEAHLSLRHGLAFDFSRMEIGNPEAGADLLSADHLFLKIDPVRLLTGRISFDRIVLSGPRLTITLTPSPGENRRDPASALLADRSLLENALIHSLVLEDGRVRLIDRRDPEKTFTVNLGNIQGRIANFSWRSTARVELSGDLEQPGKGGAFEISGGIVPKGDFSRWRQAHLSLNIGLQHVDPGPFLRHYSGTDNAISTKGRVSGALKLNGSTAGGLRLNGQWRGESLSLALPHLYREPLALGTMALDGTWTWQAEAHRASDLSLQLDELNLGGHYDFRRQGGAPWIEANFFTPDLDLAQIKRFLPDRLPAGNTLKTRWRGGSLRISSARFAGSAEDYRDRQKIFALQQAAVSLRGASYRDDRLPDVDGIEVSVTWQDRALQLTEGRLRVADMPLIFAGSLQVPPQEAPTIDLNVSGTLRGETLLAMVPDEKRQGLILEGPVPIDLELSGTREKLVLDAGGDLQSLAADMEGKIGKPSGLPGKFFLTADIAPERIELNHGRLSIPPLELRGRGHIDRNEKKDFALVLDLDPLDMQKTGLRTPLLAPLEPQGKVGLHLELEGADSRLLRRRGQVMLRDFGIRVPGPVADLRRANGEITLSADRGEIKRLSAQIGDSPVAISGTLIGGGNPHLDLQVRSDAIRARDLIFPSGEAVLRDVDGHLIISKKGIDFSPVTVRLDGGTEATVKGTLRDFKNPQVNLKIEAPHANIDEVIGLWKRPEEPSRRKEIKKKHRVGLLIKAAVREGTLGELKFQQAEGEIFLRDGNLIIYPLQFASGEGRCNGRVVVQRTAGEGSWLKISGHLVNVDAAGLHRTLLKRRGLVSGTLSGDFYLEGKAGKEFLASSMGGFDLKIKDGVLRKFEFLSKVFSILNITQIFELKLPDMDRDGMPFDRLTANIGLQKGVLSTEDLFIKSNAMNLSLVGDLDLVRKKLDLVLGVKPLKTVDKIITQIPIAGWLLTGEEKALITAHFQITGDTDDPEVVPIPISSVSEQVLGIFKRVLGLPGKVVTDMGEILNPD